MFQWGFFNLWLPVGYKGKLCGQCGNMDDNKDVGEALLWERTVAAYPNSKPPGQWFDSWAVQSYQGDGPE